MDKQILKAINKAYHMPMPKENVIGLVVMLVYSKDVFRTNFAVNKFVMEVFNITFLSYAIRSRTLMCAKICRHINELQEDQLKKIVLNLLSFLSNVRDNELYFDDNDNKNMKKSNAYQNMNKWISGTKKED